MLEVERLDACDPLSVIVDFGPRLHEGIENDVAVVVNDGDSSEPLPLSRQDALTV